MNYQPYVPPMTHAQIHAEACKRPEYKPRTSCNERRTGYDAVAGPLAGKFLSLWSPSTLVFSLHGRRGRYEMNSERRLVWREHRDG